MNKILTFWVEENVLNGIMKPHTLKHLKDFCFRKQLTFLFKNKNTKLFCNTVFARLVIKPCTECLGVERNCLRSKRQHVEINLFVWLIVISPVKINESENMYKYMFVFKSCKSAVYWCQYFLVCFLIALLLLKCLLFSQAFNRLF